jgi:16S rRNA (cytidine1402-2'-O)-methyltransferase
MDEPEIHDLKSRAEKGVLYIVATPIGNMQDMTFRGVDILSSVDLIAAEDTRHTAGLLSYFNIRSQLISCHEHNEAQRADQIVEKLKSGASVALVSNAGTPAVSDPGYRIIKEAIAGGIRVIPIPGASAAIAAISASAMPSDMFCFIGFVPKKKGRQDALLKELADRKETLVFYESPRRLVALLQAIARHMGNRHVVVARELTKLHEEFLRGPVTVLIDQLEQRERIRGEVTLLVAGSEDQAGQDMDSLEDDIRKAIQEAGHSTSRLAVSLAKRYNLSKNEIYQEILKVKSQAKTDGDEDEKGEI